MRCVGGGSLHSLVISDKAISFSCGHATGCLRNFAIGNFKIGPEEAGSRLAFRVGHSTSNFTPVCYTMFYNILHGLLAPKLLVHFPL